MGTALASVAGSGCSCPTWSCKVSNLKFLSAYGFLLMAFSFSLLSYLFTRLFIFTYYTAFSHACQLLCWLLIIFIQKMVFSPMFLVSNYRAQVHIFHAAENVCFYKRVGFFQFCN